MKQNSGLKRFCKSWSLIGLLKCKSCQWYVQNVIICIRKICKIMQLWQSKPYVFQTFRMQGSKNLTWVRSTLIKNVLRSQIWLLHMHLLKMQSNYPQIVNRFDNLSFVLHPSPYNALHVINVSRYTCDSTPFCRLSFSKWTGSVLYCIALYCIAKINHLKNKTSVFIVYVR